jgi:hypothetical protein
MGKPPAKMFNEGNWTYTAFKDYAIAAQNALNALPEASSIRQFYALAGCSPYYWVGMTNAGGEKIADVCVMTFQPLTDTVLKAASILRTIKSENAMDPQKQVDLGVVFWNEGSALFTTGDLWFVNANNR